MVQSDRDTNNLRVRKYLNYCLLYSINTYTLACGVIEVHSEKRWLNIVG
jgi:hypothetical protein